MGLAFPRRLPRADIDSKQQQLLQRQLQHCAQQVPHYQRLFQDLDIDAQSTEAFSSLKQLPVLYKDDIRGNEPSFFARSFTAANSYTSFSSGSTGQPFASYFDRRAWLRKKFYLKLRARFACGMRWRDRVAILEAESEESVAHRNRFARWRDCLLKVRVFSLFQPPEQLLQQLQQFAPHNIYAYPSHLLELLAAIAAADTKQKPLPDLSRIFTSSEFLSTGVRTEIEQAFKATVFDHYGNTEFKEVAWECTAHSMYHINHDELIVETLVDGQPVVDEPGEIVLTELRNRAMPLLRYSTGDFGILTNRPCACGYQGPSMKPLGGRCSDYLIMPDDSRISPFLFTTALETVPHVRQYQILQLAPTELRVSLVSSLTSAEKFEQQQEQVAKALRNCLSGKCAGEFKISVVREDHIQNEANGKFKVIKRELG